MRRRRSRRAERSTIWDNRRPEGAFTLSRIRGADRHAYKCRTFPGRAVEIIRFSEVGGFVRARFTGECHGELRIP
jgi:hypothetical protein